MRSHRIPLITFIISVLSLFSYSFMALREHEAMLPKESYRAQEDGNIEDIWFKDPHTLIVISHTKDHQASVTFWHTNGKLSKQSLNLTSEALRAPASASLIYQKKKELHDGVIYSISQDGQQLAWVWKNKLHQSTLPQHGISNPEEAEVSGSKTLTLAFIENAALCLIHADGKLELWGGHPLTKGRAGSWLEDGDWELFSKGNPLLTGSRQTGDFCVIHTYGKDKINLLALFRPNHLSGSTAALSPKREVAIGTESGRIVLLERNTEKTLAQLDQPVHSLVFAAESVLLASGRYNSVYFLAKGGTFKINTPSVVDHVSALGEQYAYTTEGAIHIGSIKSQGITTGQTCMLLISSLLALLSGLSLLRKRFAR